MKTNNDQPNLAQLIEYYAVCNRSENKSPKTIVWYTANLLQFQRYLNDNRLPTVVTTMSLRCLREYVNYLLQRERNGNGQRGPLSSSTVHAHVRTLKAFFSWLKREDFIGENPASQLKPPKITRKLISTLSDEEIRSILNTLNPKLPLEVRNKVMFTLMLDTGIRSGEAVNLTLADVYITNGYLKVFGKGRKERIVPIGNIAQRALNGYMFRYRSKPAYDGIENVFLNAGGYPMTGNGVKLLFARLSKKSGVSRLHAHLCRHTFATRYLINGGDVFSLQQILGHTTLEMVRHYVNLASSHVMIQHNRYSPMDRITKYS